MASTQFGLNVSASVESGVDPVREAQAAEEFSFDLVSVNDHMHGPEQRYECWTLLSWIAANTSRLLVASRVLGLPYRAPAVTAKMAETFARLSGGRLILGLGAGSGEDEYLALGLDAPPLGERLTGLEEAIQITRGLWTAATLTFAGSVFKVTDGQIEPKPDQPIPIWLGTHGPRGLELTGRLADGWIPSFGSLPPDRVPAALEMISEAARGVGRDPASLTRIYNVEISLDEERRGDPTLVAGNVAVVRDALSSMLSLGFDGFNLIVRGGDRHRQLERIAAEILPAVRTASAGA